MQKKTQSAENAFRLLIFTLAAFISWSLEPHCLLIQIWRSSVTDACKQYDKSYFICFLYYKINKNNIKLYLKILLNTNRLTILSLERNSLQLQHTNSWRPNAIGVGH